MPGVLVLIPSYNVASTIAYVVSTAAQGLKKFFPEYENMILVSDGGSIDGTVDVVKSLRIEDVKISVERYKGVSGKGSATIYGFKKALENDYDAVIMLDSDLRSIEPWWIKLLGEATKKYDLVTPIYVRDKWDGTITKTLAYPTIKSVFKAEIRQPIGGDFGISRRLLEKAFENVELFTLD
ncbi:MAG: glycosyltransferase, partial [Thermoprotei archaeon]